MVLRTSPSGPNHEPFTNATEDGGNPSLNVAPDDAVPTGTIADSDNVDVLFLPEGDEIDGIYRYTFSVTFKLVSGAYRTDDYLAVISIINGVVALLGTPVQLDIGGNSTGLTTTITAVAEGINVNVDNATGAAGTAYVWAGPLKGNLL